MVRLRNHFETVLGLIDEGGGGLGDVVEHRLGEAGEDA